MSLLLQLKYAEKLRGKADRLAKVSFRGVAHYSKIIENAEENATFDETFEWPVARPIECEEVIEIMFFNYNKYLSNRLIGTFRMVLQRLVEDGAISISDCMIDENNVVMKSRVTFELTYNAPDGSVGAWQKEGFEQHLEDDGGGGHFESDEKLLLHPSDDSVPSSPSKSFRGSHLSIGPRSPQALKSPTKAMKSMKQVVKMMKLGKQRPPPDDEDNASLGSKGSGGHRERFLSVPDDRFIEEESSDGQTPGGNLPGSLTKRVKPNTHLQMGMMKAQDFQVCITVIEARQLAGLNMDPVVCVQVGDQKKYTSVKESTNCPYYNEYFVFDFHMPPAMLFDKIISMTVLQSRTFIRSNKLLGSFKLDVGTVYATPDHQFYHKWAMLTDPDDINGGPKGYLKCDLAVVGKGDSVKAPPKTDKDEDDIEANLLLPDGVPAERQRARFIIKIYKAEGLPKMNTGLMANVKKAFTGECKDLVDPYVSASFAGHKGKTTVKKGCYEPSWNEQIVFTEMFPPLCRRIRVQLCDADSVNEHVIGTHFLDLGEISNDGEKGFLPTFGPSWINLYGSTRNYSLLEEHSHLNCGLGEGVSFRGRLLVALKTEILDASDTGPSMVDVESCLPVAESSAGRPEEFFLFGTIFDATMIDRKVGEKPIRFELSIGNYGNSIDGQNTSVSIETESDDEEKDEEEKDKSLTEPEWHSTTAPSRPATRDRCYYYIPYEEDKPLLWVKAVFEDHRRRMYNTNMIEKIITKLEDDLADLSDLVKQERPHTEKTLRGILEELASSCSKYISLNQSKSAAGGAQAGRNKLDKERFRLCQREVETLGLQAHSIKAAVNKNNFKEKLKGTHHLLHKLIQMASEPQHALPDIFVWMISNNKRVAYQRIPAKDIIYSMVDEEKGIHCGRMQTLLLKLPGKRGTGQSGWAIQAKLQVYIWLGINKHKKEVLKGLPSGYEDNPALRRTCRILGTPPASVQYTERQVFQLRAHMYQSRSLIGSDESGLSDPFARVIFGDQSHCTQVIEETLSPTWDEMLIFNETILYGGVEEIKEDPPTVVIEIFDQDKVGKSEFIGRAVAKPAVKISHEKYEPPYFPPKLEWFDIYRGSDRAGELLAAFELLQLAPPGDISGEDLPPLEMPELDDKDRGPIMPVPKGIRPTLSKYRIEVLFWGVRDLKRIQFISVDRPRIDIECAGQVLASSVIQNAKKHPNFQTMVKFFDVELPDNELYCPPITIRCVDCRNFGRFILVGTHVINNISRFMYIPTTRTAKEAIKKFLAAQQGDPEYTGSLMVPAVQPAKRLSSSGNMNTYQGPPTVTVETTDDVAIVVDEKAPLINREQVITIDSGIQILKADKLDKAAEKLKNEKKSKRGSIASASEDGEMDEATLDWWSKYLASVDTMIRELNENDGENDGSDGMEMEGEQEKEKTGQKPGKGNYGAIPNGTTAGEVTGEGDTKKTDKVDGNKKEGEGEPKPSRFTFKGAAKAVSLAHRLSPKLQRKKEIIPTASQLKVYHSELEAQPEFSGFKEWLHTFELYRGKKTGDAEDDESRVVGKFKGSCKVYKVSFPADIEDSKSDSSQCQTGSLKVYKVPLPPDIEDTTLTGGDPQYGLFQGLPTNDPVHVLVRVYVVKAIDLHPADINGKADPYIIIRLGKNVINDKENYVSKQLNPVFGKCFEVEATFPLDASLQVQVYDWDLVGTDDLIGETVVDLENRFYSRHRATCGLAYKYDEGGHNVWRDPTKPTQVLHKLCKDARLDGPHIQPGKIRVANRVFTAPMTDDYNENEKRLQEEQLALAVLHRWDEIPKVGCKLVPEHVETRALYNHDKPGIEQGKLEMWVDMFPLDMPAPGPIVNIAPRKPKSYELRCIIWNTDDVVLEDDAFFTGEKMSDIYVKGWIKGQDDMQCTDIHYRSLTGEGNFNWRFIFPFDYLVAEEKIVISRKETMFSWDETETKIPARLNLQVWDADHFSADDFLGALTLDLNRFPRGAKNSKQCTLDMLKQDGSVPQMSLFKHKRLKGWWPFHAKNEGDEEMELTKVRIAHIPNTAQEQMQSFQDATREGKVEAELHLLTLEEGEKHPAGLARSEPDPLEKPNRPDSSFIWFLSPLKSIRYILWRNYKWVIIKAIVIFLLSIIIALFFYSMPGYMVKKMMGA